MKVVWVLNFDVKFINYFLYFCLFHKQIKLLLCLRKEVAKKTHP